MNSPVVQAFFIGHPFWDEAVSLRQSQHTYDEILAIAHAAGHASLTLQSLRRGLRRAPADLNLPAAVTPWLRRKYEKLDNAFSAYAQMRTLAMRAMESVAEIEEMLDDETLTESRRIRLGQDLWRWYGRAYDWAAKCVDVQLRLEGVDMLGDGRATAAHAISTNDAWAGMGIAVAELLDAVFGDARVIDAEVLQRYGHDHVRPPEPETGGGSDVDEDEDLA